MSTFSIALTTTGLGTLYGEILDPDDNTKRWDGSAFTAFSAISDANYSTGLMTLTEQLTSDATATGVYVGTTPAGITANGEYPVIARLTAAVGARVEGEGSFTLGAKDGYALSAAGVSVVQSGLSTLDAAGVRTAIGMAAANLDDQLALVVTYIDAEVAAILEDTGTTLPALIAALNDPSVVEIWAGLNATQLAKFITVDTGETTAAAGSVVKIAQGSAGGNVTVGAMTQAALAQFVTDDTGETAATDGSVASLCSGSAVTVTPITGSIAGRFSSPLVSLVQYEEISYGPWSITDADGDAIDLSGVDLAFVVYSLEGDPAELWRLTSTASEITVGGAENNQVTLTDDDTNTQTAGRFGYTLWDTTNGVPKQRGILAIERSAGPTAPT